jgi:hypothetical protein
MRHFLAASLASVVALLSAGSASTQEALAVILTPKTATNPVNAVHCVSAQVVGGTGPVVVFIVVTDAITGEVLVSSSGTVTPLQPTHNFCYQGPPDPRVDRITAFVDSNDNEMQDVGEPFDEGSKAWIIETAAPGRATGGGHIAGVLRQVGFSLTAKSTDVGFDGHCRVFDPEPDVRIRCIDVDSLLILGTHASFAGDATVNDAPTRYQIEVDDLGEPGKDRDTFTIRTDSGYVATGVLVNGNINVRS